MTITTLTHKLKGYNVDNLERLAGDRWVTMSNALTRAGQGLTLAEKRIVACAVSKLDSRGKQKLAEVIKTRITAAEYAETFQVDTDTAYNQLQAAADNLYSRSITFYNPAYKRHGKPIAASKVRMRWVGKAEYQKGEGWVELSWWPDILPHLYFTRA
jgi:plasmid replication initiation protein